MTLPRMIALSIVAGLMVAAICLGGTIEWKGVTWTITNGPDGNVVTSADGSVTLPR